MGLFTQDTLRRVYLKPLDHLGNNFVQYIKIPKHYYWPVANMLAANPDHRGQTYFYGIIHFEATFAKQSMARVAKSIFSEILYDPNGIERADYVNNRPLITPTRKREIALAQQLLACEFAMQGGEKPFVRFYDATDADFDVPEVYI